jgi:hypothetical protein
MGPDGGQTRVRGDQRCGKPATQLYAEGVSKPKTTPAHGGPEQAQRWVQREGSCLQQVDSVDHILGRNQPYLRKPAERARRHQAAVIREMHRVTSDCLSHRQALLISHHEVKECPRLQNDSLSQLSTPGSPSSRARLASR